MKKRIQVRRNGSPAAATQQAKPAQARTRSSMQEDRRSGLRIFDRSVREEVCAIPLSGAELPSVVAASYQLGISADQFIADAIKEKLGRPGGKAPRPVPAPEDRGFIMGEIVLKLADAQGNEVGTVNLDEFESGLLQKAAAKSGLDLSDLFSFIVHRQLEAFFPPEVKGLYRVSDHTLKEIASGLEAAEQDSNALWAVCRALIGRVEKTKDLVSPADCMGALSELKGLCVALEDLASTVRGNVSDVFEHWKIAGCPALLEQRIAPVSIPSARAAA